MRKQGSWELVGNEGDLGGPQILTSKRRVEGGYLYHVMVMAPRWWGRGKLHTSLAFVPDSLQTSNDDTSGEGYE